MKNKIKLITVALLMLLTYSCDAIEQQEKQANKERAEAKRHEKLAERMEVIFKHSEITGVKQYYGLRDKTTGREYLIVLTSHREGGVAVIELKPKEEEKY